MVEILIRLYLQEFFLNVKDLTRQITSEKLSKQFDAWNKAEHELQIKFNTTKDDVHTALCGKDSVFFWW